MGFYRNLTAGEILLQVLEVEWLVGVNISNVVFMGMGEPLHNYEQTIKAVRLLTDENGIGLSARRLTVSTVGLVPMIERWREENPLAKLAISLHAPTDEQRLKLMPVNKAYPLEMLFKSLRRYAHVTKHSITFEYIMIEDFNDRKEDAINLRKLLQNIPAKMNLIRLHPTGSGLQPSSDDAIDRFMGYLVAEGVRCTLRQSRGVDAEAACGMLFSQEPFRPSKARAWEGSGG
jgi:23S rRNA (adenine2503-C2)-methyltransferase